MAFILRYEGILIKFYKENINFIHCFQSIYYMCPEIQIQKTNIEQTRIEELFMKEYEYHRMNGAVASSFAVTESSARHQKLAK